MTKTKIPSRCIERLSIYRRALLQGRDGFGPSIFSHQIASACRLTAAQVRRDLMLIGYSGSPTTGYEVKRLLSSIGALLDPVRPREVAIVGMGYLGRAIASFLVGRLPKMRLAAVFDVDPEKIGSTFSGVSCFSTQQMDDVMEAKHIDVAILTVPASDAQSEAEHLVHAGVTGILNFAPVCLHLPNRIYVENIDMTVALEKVAFFASGSHKKKGNIDEHRSANDIDQTSP
jgi:redox-sensing transcriptional repressor